MRTIIFGPVTAQDIEDADLLAGIVPTCYVTNGLSIPPAMPKALFTEVNFICPMLPELGERQRNYTMVLRADALICSGSNEHLLKVARQYGLLIHEVTP